MAEQSFQKSVLIVDDIPASMDILVETLIQSNFDVLIAESGQQTLQVLHHAALQESLPDIILLDVVMPGMDGFETCRQIKAIPELEHIPVLFVTARNESVEKVRGFDVGGVDYITKPVDLIEFQARINTHLKLNQLQQQLLAENDSLRQERRNLLDLMNAQSDQLRELTASALTTRDRQRQSILRLLAEQVQGRLTLLISHLNETQSGLQVDHSSPDSFRLDRETVEHLQGSITLLTETTEQITQMLGDLRQEAEEIPEDDPLLVLSAREREVLNLIATGKDNREIAAILYIESSTVRTYRTRIMNKLGANNAYDLMRVALAYVGG
ncbi:MAG: response regulator [Chloroflexota bacterium]